MNSFPHTIVPMAREFLAGADQVPDGELIRIAGVLRGLADEVMGKVDRRLGGRMRPHLVVDNTKLLVASSAAPQDRTG